MFMKLKRNYSLVRGHITKAIRELESIQYYNSRTDKVSLASLSEYEYWISSLELIRNCIYGCQDKYQGQIDVLYSIREIRSEITNFVKVIRPISTKTLKYLDRAWLALTRAEKELK